MPFEQLLTDLGLKSHVTLVILTGALLMGRLLPLLLLSPFLGGEALDPEVKVGLGVVLAVVLFPAVSPTVPNIPVTAIPYGALLLKEIFLGLAMAFVVDIVFQAAQVAGHVLDSVSGASHAQIMVPQIGHEVTLFSSLKMQLAIVLFLTLNGHHLVINALADSLLVIPLNKFPAFSHGMWPFFDLLLHLFNELLKVGLSIAAPAFLASFLTDLALGMINRVAPQVQVFFVSMQIKPMAVTVMMLAAMHMVMERMSTEFRHMLSSLAQAIRLLT
jgi:flagellar biosynthetic protein FliR